MSDDEKNDDRLDKILAFLKESSQRNHDNRLIDKLDLAFSVLVTLSLFHLWSGH